MSDLLFSKHFGDYLAITLHTKRRESFCVKGKNKDGFNHTLSLKFRDSVSLGPRHLGPF